MIAAALYFILLGSIYILLYYFNHRTPLPQGCENLKSQCKGCQNSACQNNPALDE
ncbi:MAG: hypothetical protein K2L08_01450 [Erysipelotrichaceae bacterium]|nr:hypothetical protein [Erysipelotrichaceae bacterium]